jgi:hypothetical protein
MKIGITIFGTRIAPRFDTSLDLLIVSFMKGKEQEREKIILTEKETNGKIKEIAGLGIGTLICGALSQLESVVMAQNDIEVIPGVTGETEEVLDLLIRTQHLPKGLFWDQAVCGNNGLQWKKGCRFFKGGMGMPQRDGSGPNGRGPGQGQGKRQGRGMGKGVGPGGECLCPACGNASPHKQGVPCSSQVCPKCGKPMIRG